MYDLEMSDEEDNSLYDEILLNKYKVLYKLGGGSFSRVYNVQDMESKNYFTAKLEKIDLSHNLLEREAGLTKRLNAIGLPQFKSYGHNDKYNILIMELLGQSLEQLLLLQNNKFSIKTACMLGIQMVDRIEYIHYKKIIHRDLKPANCAMGLESKSHILYIIDFGLSTKYWNTKHNCHIPFKKAITFVGNARFCSVNASRRFQVSRRDDLESIGYLIIFLIKGALPWSVIKASNYNDLFKKICEKKTITSVKELCNDLPSELGTFISYTRNLEFTEAPDYNYLRYLLKNILKKSGFTIDFNYDWSYKKPNIKSNDPIFTKNIIKYDKSKEWLFNSECDKNDCIGMDLL